MRKGIIKIVLIYSLVMSVALIISSIIELILSSYFGVNGSFMIIMFVPTLLGFILLGFRVNKKYESTFDYWKFLIIGIVSSIISSLIHNLYFMVFRIYFPSGMKSWEFWINNYIDIYYINSIPVIGLMIFQCIIIGFFYKRLKKQHFRSTESLDSNIVNEE